MNNADKTMDKIVALCKGRGYVYPGSEIYGGLANTWDYGPLGVEFKNNVKKAFDGTNKDIQTAKALQILTRKPGIYGMIGGQTVDVEQENKAISFDTLMYIHNNKTAALIECAMMIGAVLAGASEKEVSMIEQIANKVGIAFQIEDDILDVVSTSEEIGKPAGSDEKNGDTKADR